jgi:hypothetical protein
MYCRACTFAIIHCTCKVMKSIDKAWSTPPPQRYCRYKSSRGCAASYCQSQLPAPGSAAAAQSSGPGDCNASSEPSVTPGTDAGTAGCYGRCRWVWAREAAPPYWFARAQGCLVDWGHLLGRGCIRGFCTGTVTSMIRLLFILQQWGPTCLHFTSAKDVMGKALAPGCEDCV